MQTHVPGRKAGKNRAKPNKRVNSPIYPTRLALPFRLSRFKPITVTRSQIDSA